MDEAKMKAIADVAYARGHFGTQVGMSDD